MLEDGRNVGHLPLQSRRDLMKELIHPVPHRIEFVKSVEVRAVHSVCVSHGATVAARQVTSMVQKERIDLLFQTFNAAMEGGEEGEEAAGGGCVLRASLSDRRCAA
jgi:hypothetical protein